jgi:hypothetical protein
MGACTASLPPKLRRTISCPMGLILLVRAFEQCKFATAYDPAHSDENVPYYQTKPLELLKKSQGFLPGRCWYHGRKVSFQNCSGPLRLRPLPTVAEGARSGRSMMGSREFGQSSDRRTPYREWKTSSRLCESKPPFPHLYNHSPGGERVALGGSGPSGISPDGKSRCSIEHNRHIRRQRSTNGIDRDLLCC